MPGVKQQRIYRNAAWRCSQYFCGYISFESFNRFQAMCSVETIVILQIGTKNIISKITDEMKIGGIGVGYVGLVSGTCLSDFDTYGEGA